MVGSSQKTSTRIVQDHQHLIYGGGLFIENVNDMCGYYEFKLPKSEKFAEKIKCICIYICIRVSDVINAFVILVVM